MRFNRAQWIKRRTIALLGLIGCGYVSLSAAQLWEETLVEEGDTSSSEVKQEDGMFKMEASYTWTPKSAREASFKNAAQKASVIPYAPVDPHYDENRSARETEESQVADRHLTVFRDGGYCVSASGETETYCYRSDGSLSKVAASDKAAGTDAYPAKVWEYSYPQGKLLKTHLQVNQGESYVFEPDGTLYAHWLGRYAYDESGVVIMSRKQAQTP